MLRVEEDLLKAASYPVPCFTAKILGRFRIGTRQETAIDFAAFAGSPADFPLQQPEEIGEEFFVARCEQF